MIIPFNPFPPIGILSTSTATTPILGIDQKVADLTKRISIFFLIELCNTLQNELIQNHTINKSILQANTILINHLSVQAMELLSFIFIVIHNLYY